MCCGLDIVWTLILQKVTSKCHKLILVGVGKPALYQRLPHSTQIRERLSGKFKSYLRNQTKTA